MKEIEVNCDGIIEPQEKNRLKRNLQVTFIVWLFFGVFQLTWNEHEMSERTKQVLLITNVVYIFIPGLGLIFVRNETLHAFEYVFGSMVFEFLASNMVLLLDAFKHGFWASTWVAMIVDIVFTVVCLKWGYPWLQYVNAKAALIEKELKRQAEQESAELQANKV